MPPSDDELVAADEAEERILPILVDLHGLPVVAGRLDNDHVVRLVQFVRSGSGPPRTVPVTSPDLFNGLSASSIALVTWSTTGPAAMPVACSSCAGVHHSSCLAVTPQYGQK